MNNYTMQEGQFTLFKNDKKTDNAQPDYTGKIMQNGKEMRLAAWVKEGKSGKFFSGKVSAFREEQTKPSSRDQEYGSQDNGGLPF